MTLLNLPHQLPSSLPLPFLHTYQRRKLSDCHWSRERYIANQPSVGPKLSKRDVVLYWLLYGSGISVTGELGEGEGNVW